MGHEIPEDYSNADGSGMWNTDIITVFPNIEPDGGATKNVGYVILDAINEVCVTYFYIGDNVDPDRKMYITWDVYRADANGDTITIKKTGYKALCDGVTTSAAFWDDDADTLPVCNQYCWVTKTWELSVPNVVANSHYVFSITMNEAGRSVRIYSVAVRYYVKRVVPT